MEKDEAVNKSVEFLKEGAKKGLSGRKLDRWVKRKINKLLADK